VHALADDPDRLWDATRDWLHQHYREPAMPRSYALVTALRAAGYAAVVSGAGPSVLVLGRVTQLAGLDTFPAPGFELRRCGIGPGAQLQDPSATGIADRGASLLLPDTDSRPRRPAGSRDHQPRSSPPLT
jgi:hypothetical protein